MFWPLLDQTEQIVQ